MDAKVRRPLKFLKPGWRKPNNYYSKLTSAAYVAAAAAAWAILSAD